MKYLVYLCLITCAVWLSTPQVTRACTTFSVDTPAGPLVAKSFDWSTGDGWVVLNERGRARTLLFPAQGGSDWQARYASLSLTTLGPGFPISGMNEAGLVIETLVDLSEEAPTQLAPGVPTGLEFVQMGLDSAGSVKELVQLVQRTKFSQLAVSLHFFACDRSGACAVIEAHAGRVHTTMGRGLKIEALANRRYAVDLADSDPSWFDAWFGHDRESSAARFATAAKTAASKSATKSVLLDTLREVAIAGHTKWQLVWDLERAQLHLRQPGLGPDVTSLQAASFPRCHGAPRVMQLDELEGSSRAWSEADAARSQAAVRAQLSATSRVTSSSPVAALAAHIAQATLSTRCVSNR